MLSAKAKRWVYRTYDVGVIAAVLLMLLYVYLHTYGNMVVRSSSKVVHGVSSTIILDENGREITRLKLSGRGYAEYASLQEMPEMLVQAF